MSKPTQRIHRPRVQTPEQQAAEQALRKQFPYFQVFTPPHRESVALEPMSCNVDAFNNRQGLIALEPDKEWKCKMEVVFK